MQTAGGIVALIAGIFGVFAGFLTLIAGGFGGATGASRANLITMLGWGGIIVSFLVILLGAMTIYAHRRVPAILLVIVSLVGLFAGGTLVTIFMVLALTGGILALFQRPTVQQL